MINRLPPGQYLVTSSFPVLDLGVRPSWDEASYKLEITGLVEKPISLSLEELRQLPVKDFTADFHCVTRWSKYDIKWRGVEWAEIEKLVSPKPEARFVISSSLDGYSTNNSLGELQKPSVFLAFELEGKPLPADHGAPLRVIIPHLYGWKGAKFLNKLEFVAYDEPGFWEVRGYHNHGDPWTEERYG